MKCLVIQPIHPAGLKLLEEAGIEPVMASSHDMATVAREIAGCDAAITRNAGLDRAAMSAAANLKILGNHGIGTDPVALDYAREIGLPVVFTPYANVQSVAEQAIAGMLAIAKRVREADAAVRSGNFDFRYSRDFVELDNRVLAIMGFGRIGRRTAEIARAAFGMTILVHSPSADPAEIEAAGFEAEPDFEAALARADYVSLHQRLTPRTRGAYGREALRAMKPGAAIVNTARGALIDTQALIEAVESGHLRGAAIDVFETEPLPKDHPLTKVRGIVLSPHIGGATEDAMERTAIQVARQVADALAGRKPEHLVDPTVWSRRRLPQPS